MGKKLDQSKILCRIQSRKRIVLTAGHGFNAGGADGSSAENDCAGKQPCMGGAMSPVYRSVYGLLMGGQREFKEEFSRLTVVGKRSFSTHKRHTHALFATKTGARYFSRTTRWAYVLLRRMRISRTRKAQKRLAKRLFIRERGSIEKGTFAAIGCLLKADGLTSVPRSIMLPSITVSNFC